MRYVRIPASRGNSPCCRTVGSGSWPSARQRQLILPAYPLLHDNALHHRGLVGIDLQISARGPAKQEGKGGYVTRLLLRELIEFLHNLPYGFCFCGRNSMTRMV